MSHNQNKARKELFAKQRKERGFDDSETWGLNTTIARFVLPRLKRFRDYSHASIPSKLLKRRAARVDWKGSEKAWTALLDEMIYAFQVEADDNTMSLADDEWKRRQRGLELFAEHYAGLWW